jgi:hypothetical protein
MTVITTIDALNPICVREEELTPQIQGFGGRRKGNYDQRYFQVTDAERGVSVTNDSARAIADVYNVRHRHVFSQVRYVRRGSFQFGRDTMGPGDVQFVPDSVHYGPMRSEYVPGGENLHFLQTQFAGPTGRVWVDKEQVPWAQEELAKYGTFDNGIYRPTGGKPMDAFEAIMIGLERNNFKLSGHEDIGYPPMRVPHPLYVRSSELPWLQHAASVEVKHLMYMFETGPNVKLLRLGKGAVLPGGQVSFQQTRWLVEGSVSWNDEEFNALSCMFYPPNVRYPETRSQEDGTTILVIQWTNSGWPRIPFIDV